MLLHHHCRHDQDERTVGSPEVGFPNDDLLTFPHVDVGSDPTLASHCCLLFIEGFLLPDPVDVQAQLVDSNDVSVLFIRNQAQGIEREIVSSVLPRAVGDDSADALWSYPLGLHS